MEHAELERLLSDAFQGGERTSRELRLSDEDARLLAQRYPVGVQPLGEQWYEVIFKEAHQLGA
jgi:hypothetical protein